MMAAKPTTPFREKRPSPSPSSSIATRRSPSSSLAGAKPSSPALPKKPSPAKTSPSSVAPPRRSTPPAATASAAAANRAHPIRRPAEKFPSPSGRTQRSPTISAAAAGRPERVLKPASPATNSPKPNLFRAAPTVSRTTSTRTAPKARGSSSAPVKKKQDSTAAVAAAAAVEAAASPPPANFSSDHEDITHSEPDDDVEMNRLKSKTQEELKNVEDEEENHMEEEKDVELELCQIGMLETNADDEIFKELKKAEQVTSLRKQEEMVETVEMSKPRCGEVATVPVPTSASASSRKKDAPKSNDVIEETKSKLMGTRKNKVLALVGAFETVISLQEPEIQPVQKSQSQPLHHDSNSQSDQGIQDNLEVHTDKLVQADREDQVIHESQKYNLAHKDQENQNDKNIIHEDQEDQQSEHESQVRLESELHKQLIEEDEVPENNGNKEEEKDEDIQKGEKEDQVEEEEETEENEKGEDEEQQKEEKAKEISQG